MAARVTAAKYFVGQLRQFGTENRVSFGVSIAGFASAYRQRLPWTALTEGSAGRVDGVLDAMRPRDTGYETDYWTALDGTRRSFQGRADTRPSACRAVVWFTDGQLALSTRKGDDGQRYGLTKPYSGSLKLTSASAVRTATRKSEQDLCRPGGVADALRSGGVTTFALGLQGRNPQNFSLLTRIATGRDSTGSTCGRITSPSPGSFQPVSDIDDLLLAFDALGSAGQPQINTTSGVCQRRLCSDFAHTFVLDRSISSVHILATSGAPSAYVVLTLPNGRREVLSRLAASRTRTTTANDVGLRYRWASDRSVVIDLTEGPRTSGWPGQWALTFVDPTGTSARAVSRSNIHISSDIFPVVAARPTGVLRSGSTSIVTFGLVDAARKRVDPASLLGTVSLSATLVDGTGATVATLADGVGKAALGRSVSLPLRAVSPGTATLRLSLAITTAPATRPDGTRVQGTRLTPQVSEQDLTVLPPLNYPTVRGAVDFGSVTGAAHATAKLSVTGPGCVWLPSDATTTVLVSPSGIGATNVHAVDASSAGRCLRLGAGQHRTLRLRLDTQRQGRGELNGEVLLSLRSAQSDGAPVTTRIRFAANLKPRFDTSAGLLAFVIALLLGLLIPLLILYIGKRSEAKFPPGTRYVERFPITVRDGRVLREGAPLVLRDSDFVTHHFTVPKGGDRRVNLAGLDATAAISLAPGSPAYGAVDAKNLLVATGNRGAATAALGEGKIALALRSTWILLHDPVGSADVAELVLVVGAHSPREDRAALLADAAQRAPDALARIRAAGPAAPGGRKRSEDPFDDGAAPLRPDGEDPFGPGPHAPDGRPPTAGGFGVADGSRLAPGQAPWRPANDDPFAQ